MSDSNSKNRLLSIVKEHCGKDNYQQLHWEGSFFDYLSLVEKKPNVARNSFQRMYDMIISYGKREYIDYKKTVTHYSFFDDPIENGKDAVFGLDVQLMKLVNFLRSAALGYGTEKRVLLLHGPVGSAKSTITRLLKKGLERYSQSDEGALYTFEWKVEGEKDILGSSDIMPSPMNEEPLLLIPKESREEMEKRDQQGQEREL